MTGKEFQHAAEQLRPKLTALAQRYTAAPDDAEDIVQDVLLKLWQMRDRLHPPIDHLAAVMTHHKSISWLRRQKRRYPLTEMADGEDESDDRIEQLLAAIDSLPDVQRKIILLRHLDELSIGDIAIKTEKTEATVRKTLSRARKAIRLAITASVLALITTSILVMLRSKPDEEECVAYIYGKEVTDPEAVRNEMRRTMNEMSAPQIESQIELQLKDMFTIE